jgi:hypothetical protein
MAFDFWRRTSKVSFCGKRQWVCLGNSTKVMTVFNRAMLRLTLLKLTKERMLLNPNHLQRDVDPASLSTPDGFQPQSDEAKTWKGKKTGLVHPQMDATIQLNGNVKPETNGFTPAEAQRKYEDVTEYLMSKVLTPEKLRKPEDTVSILNRLGKLGEVLYILRPLIYGMYSLHDRMYLNTVNFNTICSAGNLQIWPLLLATMADLLDG